MTHNRSLVLWLSVLGLVAFWGLGLWQAITTSPTFDEGFTLIRGYAAWRTGHWLPIGHPPLAHTLAAAGVLLEPGLPDPASLPGWATDDYDVASRALLWERGLDAQRLLFLGRLPNLLVGLCLAALTARWARELFGWPGALIALLLHALSPNFLAHGALATTDVPLAFTFTLTLYAWRRYTRRPTPRGAWGLGLALGLALASKFSSFSLLPILAALALVETRRRRALAWLGPLWRAPLLAVPTLWATYGFHSAPYPLAAYFQEVVVFLSFARAPQTAYLLGQLSAEGWWYYYLVAFAVKTPLPVLGLGGLAVLNGRRWLARHSALWLPVALFFGATFLSRLNLGYRYLLPILPLVHLLAAGALGPARWRGGLVGLALVGQLLTTLAAAPRFIPYFNELVGSANGHRVLSDSNVDWGQDLPALAAYLAGRPVHLAYFGLADPGYYGITWAPLPAWPPPAATDFVPADPAPGLYAVSASNLSGVQLIDVNALSFFRGQTPLAVLNHAVFIYAVPERPPAATLVQCAPPTLSEADTARFLHGRPVRRVTVMCADALLQPPGPALTLFGAGQTPWLDLGPAVYESLGYKGEARYRVYRSEPRPAPAQPFALAPYLSLLRYEVAPGQLLTEWRVEAPAPTPVSIFVHLYDGEGALAAAYDALGVTVEHWQTGDVIVQRYRFDPPPAPGTYQLTVGLYSLAAGNDRYSTIPLQTVTFPASPR